MAVGDGDLEAILTNGDFNITASIWDKPGTTRLADVVGWFTEGTQQTSLLTNEIETVNPMFDCPSTTAVSSTVARGHLAVINGSNYRVERVQVNGTGMTTLHLKTE